MPINTAFVESLLAPIKPESPAGDFLRDKDPQAKFVAVETARNTSASTNNKNDWKNTVRLASDLLATGSKDLSLALWLTEALTRTEGITGAATGLSVFEGLLRQYWKTLYPPLEDDGDSEVRAGVIGGLASPPSTNCHLKQSPFARMGSRSANTGSHDEFRARMSSVGTRN